MALIKNVLLTEEEYNKLIDEGLEEYIENLSFYLLQVKSILQITLYDYLKLET